ncbi:MAG: hypothetical protein NTW21_19040 [Verrucomicrobia bacterium]|nr:hypothetical protein [Verrucomicrobiota bacterium]
MTTRVAFCKDISFQLGSGARLRHCLALMELSRVTHPAPNPPWRIRKLLPQLAAQFLLTVLPLAAANQSGPLAVFDFEADDADAEWAVLGPVTVSHAEVAALDGTPIEGVGGRCLKLKTEGGGMAYCLPGKVPGDWSAHGAIRLFLHRGADQQDKRLVIDVMATDDDGKGQLWRRLDLDFTGWARVDMPLRYFGPGDGRLIRWNEVRRLGVRFGGPSEVSIDSVALLPAGEGLGNRVTTDELSRFAFGKPAAETTVGTGRFVVLSDVKDVAFAPLEQDLGEVLRLLHSWLPMEECAADPPTLLVFANEAEYRAFPPRYAAAIKREIGPPQSCGFTIDGISAGFWDSAQGLQRPTFLHEFAHSAIEKQLRLPNRSEWFQEALANLIQTRFRPQPGLAEQITTAITNPAYQIPLRQLCNGQPVPLAHYWQTFTLMDLLLTDPALRPRLPDLVAAFRKAGSTDLAPHLGPVLGTDWQQLETRWKAFCLGRYAKRN